MIVLEVALCLFRDSLFFVVRMISYDMNDKKKRESRKRHIATSRTPSNLSTTALAFLLQSLLKLRASSLPKELIRATRSSELSLLERIQKVRAISKFRVKQITLALRLSQT
jgi:hypothetical protein